MSLNNYAAATFYVGWRGQTQPDCESLWHPNPPKSYVKDEAKQNWILDYMSESAILPFVGAMSDVCVLDHAGNVVFSGFDPSRFLTFVNGVGRFHEIAPFANEQPPFAVFIGFNVKQLFQSVAMELMRERISVPYRFWRSTPGLIDILEHLVPGDMRNGFDLGSLIQYLGPNFIPPLFDRMAGPGAAVLETAADRATVAKALADFAQL
jgi:hypothetical protein